MLNSSAELRDLFQIDALHGDIVFLFLFFGDCDSSWSIDSLVHLETQEVLDFNSLHKNMNYCAIVDDVDDDWEMGISENHFKFESDGDSSDEVSNYASSSAQTCVSLLLLKPHSEFEGLLGRFVSFLLHDLDRDMLERFFERT